MSFDLKDTIKNYKGDMAELTAKLHEKRFSLGEADSAKESRFPTGRVELEDEIKMLEQKVESTQKILSTLESLNKNNMQHSEVQAGEFVKFSIDEDILEYLLIEGLGDLNNNIISVTSPIGKNLMGMKLGEEKVLDNGAELKILELV